MNINFFLSKKNKKKKDIIINIIFFLNIVPLEEMHTEVLIRYNWYSGQKDYNWIRA